jgi:hypothetical protein
VIHSHIVIPTLRTAFIRFMTQLCTAIILVGPNPVGIMVRTTRCLQEGLYADVSVLRSPRLLTGQ